MRARPSTSRKSRSGHWGNRGRNAFCENTCGPVGVMQLKTVQETMNRRTFIASAAGLAASTPASVKRSSRASMRHWRHWFRHPRWHWLVCDWTRCTTRRFTEVCRGKQITMIESIQSQTGLDPRKDIWEIVFAYRGTAGAPLGFIRGSLAASSDGNRPLTGRSFRARATRGTTS